MIRPAIRLGLAAAAALLGGIAPASGQGPTSALEGHDTNAPIDWEADRIEVQDRSDRVVLSGNVVARQARLTLRAARITVAYSSTGGIDVHRIDATGGVTIVSPSETARGQSGIYDLDQRIITMLGDVVLTRSDANVRGGRLVLDLDNGRAVMDGGVPGSRTTPTGRVTGRFTVPQNSGSN